MANLKNITELPVAESAEGLNLIVNDNGHAKQIPASKMGGVQPDWNQNDETAPDYVKNRPFYEERIGTYLVSEMTVSIDSDGDCAILREDCPVLTVGNTYIVVLNGTTYECVARYNEEWKGILLGNETVCGDGNPGNNEPFVIDSYDGGDIYLNTLTAGEYTISIFGDITVTHKLDVKYMPEDVMIKPKNYSELYGLIFQLSNIITTITPDSDGESRVRIYMSGQEYDRLVEALTIGIPVFFGQSQITDCLIYSDDEESLLLTAVRPMFNGTGGWGLSGCMYKLLFDRNSENLTVTSYGREHYYFT